LERKEVKNLKMPHMRALQATLNSLKMSTDLWIVTAEYAVEAHGLCSDLVSHREIEFDVGDPYLGENIYVRNQKHGLVFGHDPVNFFEADYRLQKVYRGYYWFPAASDEENPALDIVEGKIPRFWTDGIFARLDLDSPLLLDHIHHVVDGLKTYSRPAGMADYPYTVIWARTMRPSLVGFVDVGENGEYPVKDEYAVRVSRPVFWGSELWAKIRREQGGQDDPALATEIPEVADLEDEVE